MTCIYRVVSASLLLMMSGVPGRSLDLTKGIDIAYFTKLRMDYAARPDFDPTWELAPERKAIVDAFKKGDTVKTIMLGKDWLEKTPVDAEIYLMMAMSEKDEGNFKGYCEYITPFYGLLESITSSGDGRSPESAFKVIAVSEEYALLHEIGARVKKQSLVGHCDKLEIERRGNKSHTIYFDASISMNALARQTGSK